MIKSTQIIHDYKLEYLEKWIGKQIESIVIPPNSTVSLDKFMVWGSRIYLGIHDCTNAGYAEIINDSHGDESSKSIDREIHQSLYVHVDKSYLPSDATYYFSDNVVRTPPLYATSIGFKDLPKFTISKIEIYGENFVLDENYQNIGVHDEEIEYSSAAIHVHHDCVFILYDEKNRVLIFEAERGGFNIFSDMASLEKVINRKVNGYVSYKNPVPLIKRIVME